MDGKAEPDTMTSRFRDRVVESESHCVGQSRTGQMQLAKLAAVNVNDTHQQALMVQMRADLVENRQTVADHVFERLASQPVPLLQREPRVGFFFKASSEQAKLHRLRSGRPWSQCLHARASHAWDEELISASLGKVCKTPVQICLRGSSLAATI